MPLKLEVEQHAIVVVGSINPSIFQPMWFAFHGLIKQMEAESAEIEVVHSEVTIFKLAWVRIEANSSRLSLLSEQAPYFEMVRDLAVGMLQLLSHTPVTAVGLNWEHIVRLSSADVWHKFGHMVAPKEPWGDTLKTPGLKELTLLGARPDEFRGNVNATVGPDMKRGIANGVRFSLNDHFEVPVDKKPATSEFAQKLLAQEWKASRERAENIRATLLRGLDQ